MEASHRMDLLNDLSEEVKSMEKGMVTLREKYDTTMKLVSENLVKM